VNHEPRLKDRLKVAFLPDYRVSLAESIIPAANLSEQISTAGMEASGTGNMKLTMNGALTIATWDGANIEIAQEVGEENIYIFGLRAEQIETLHRNGAYNPRELYDRNPLIKRVLDCFTNDRFSHSEPGLFRWIFDELVNRGDRFFHIADLSSYVEANGEIECDFLDQAQWQRMAILNTARSHKFSSDRTIREYAKEIWGIQRVDPTPTALVCAIPHNGEAPRVIYDHALEHNTAKEAPVE
jgi:starch phosphorylase